MAVETRSPGWSRPDDSPALTYDDQTPCMPRQLAAGRRSSAPDDGWRAPPPPPPGGWRSPPPRHTRSPTPSGSGPVACWPPVQWGRAPFGEDDPSRGWEGRGNLQQRQCRPDSKSCQHLPGETIQLISGGQYLEVASRVFGGEMTKIEGRWHTK